VLRVVTGIAHPAEFFLQNGSCDVGAGAGVDILIDDPAVSRKHARFTLVAEGIQFEDLDSRNGSFYLGQRISKAVLGLGSRLQIGGVVLALEPDRASLDKTRPSQLTHYGDLCGVSAAMRRLFGLLQKLEGSLVSVMLEGESGTGKELVAKAIHEQSRVSAGPFVAINCGTLDRTLARSELFGHRRGAFSGATENHAGAFAEANHGTLFLDEIGELPLDVQPLLLRALETGSIARLGEVTERPVAVRILCATHRALSEAVNAGRFREDLLYRLQVVQLRIPPLRERLDDLDLLMRDICLKTGSAELPAEIVAQLRAHSWPGNVRQLKNSILAFGALGELPTESRPTSGSLEASFANFIDVLTPYAVQKEALLQLFSRLYVERLLEHTNGNQSEAARLSKMDRSHLNKLANAFKPR
jgi:DNA-binding NtrC family response regulator